MTIDKVLRALVILFRDHNPYDPMDSKMGAECKRNRQEYDKKAKLWTLKYATKTIHIK